MLEVLRCHSSCAKCVSDENLVGEYSMKERCYSCSTDLVLVPYYSAED